MIGNRKYYHCSNKPSTNVSILIRKQTSSFAICHRVIVPIRIIVIQAAFLNQKADTRTRADFSSNEKTTTLRMVDALIMTVFNRVGTVIKF